MRIIQFRAKSLHICTEMGQGRKRAYYSLIEIFFARYVHLYFADGFWLSRLVEFMVVQVTRTLQGQKRCYHITPN